MTEGLDFDTPDNSLDVQWLPREEVEPNDWNPNVIEEEEEKMLVKSIRNHGWTRPIVVHSEELYIIDGEQRWTVAGNTYRIDGSDYSIQDDESLTPEDVPAGYVPVFGITVDEDEAKVSTIQHNRARGFVDYNSLYDYLQEFDEQGLMDELADEIELEEDGLLRIIDDQSVAEAVGEEHEPTAPWEPRDIREFDDDEMETTTRTDAMAESDESEAITRVSMVLSEREKEKVEAVFGEDNMAQTLINYVNYLDENDLIESFQSTVGIEPDEDHPHPEASD